jgi:hypothetical protein
MKLEDLVYSLESRLLNLGRRMMRSNTREAAHEETDRLVEQLQKRQEALTRGRAELEVTRRRLTENQTAAVLLTSQIESCIFRKLASQAYRHALELDRTRHTIAEDQAALPRLEQTCWSLEFQVRQLERRLARVQEVLYPCQAQRS